MAKHGVHSDPSGKHTWTEEGGHCACGQGHATTPQGDDCPRMLPIVVLRCRCDDPESHLGPGEHCPKAEIDVAASYDAGLNFGPINVGG